MSNLDSTIRDKVREIHKSAMEMRTKNPSEFEYLPAHVAPMVLDADWMGFDLDGNVYFCGKKLEYSHKIELTRFQLLAAVVAAVGAIGTASAQWYRIIFGL